MAMPQFFYNNPQELLAILRRGTRGTFAGAGTQLRENLANAGLLQSGAYPTGLINLSVAQGQQEAGVESSFLTDVYKMERGAELDFNTQKYFDEQQRKRDLMNSLFAAIGGVAGGVGSYFGGRSSGKTLTDILSRLQEG